MRIGYARNSKIWFSLSDKEKILSHENVDILVRDLEDEENFKALCCKMKKGDLLIVCGVDDIGSTRNEIEDTWRQIRDLEVEIRVITAPALLQKENMTLDELLIRDVTLSVLAFQVEIANQKLKEL
jgi:hypothetical protein|uniref:Resolvase n=1 Tax=Siphoviridae sp. ctbbV81 TaxID=2827900 RepID=A0A8S5TQT8_9CAUD|nr:MAG TPA: resolvase [Siphoviridae sp. ctbbV81]DAG27160.1 MAG TPA: resolvase [Caudoviricetes sp.]DAH50143.1 MAG TPA: resolvase [Caudoviricetes sp.]